MFRTNTIETMNHFLHIRLSSLAAAMAVLLLAAPAAADSPFDDFPELGAADTEEAPPVIDDPDQIDVDEDAPDEPVELRLNTDEPVAFEVVSGLQITNDYSPHFEPDYRSGLVVEYTPTSMQRRDRLPHWPLTEVDDDIEGGEPMIVTVTDYAARFEQPSGLNDPARMHSLLRDATFSFLLGERGEITDVRVHPPTSPLLRASVEEMMRLLANTSPLLPEDPVEPGDSWTDTITVDLEDDDNDRSLDLDATYQFESWAECPSGWCALLTVDHQIDADGTYAPIHMINEGSADGEATTRLLFDPNAGRIVSSQFDAHTRGTTTSIRPGDDDEEPEVTREYNFELHIETSTRLIER